MPWITFLLPLALTIFKGSMLSSSDKATVPVGLSFLSSFFPGFLEATAGLASFGASFGGTSLAGAAGVVSATGAVPSLLRGADFGFLSAEALPLSGAGGLFWVSSAI